jgi:hypothetical protein
MRRVTRRNGSAVRVAYQHQNRAWMGYLNSNEVTTGFRADLGFIPQADYRKGDGFCRQCGSEVQRRSREDHEARTRSIFRAPVISAAQHHCHAARRTQGSVGRRPAAALSKLGLDGQDAHDALPDGPDNYCHVFHKSS